MFTNTVPTETGTEAYARVLDAETTRHPTPAPRAMRRSGPITDKRDSQRSRHRDGPALERRGGTDRRPKEGPPVPVFETGTDVAAGDDY